MPLDLAAIANRLRSVVIEQRPAIDVMQQHDGPDTLHYVDPPYLHATRSSKVRAGRIAHAYAHEMDDTAHRQLLDALQQIRGMVVLSGYPSQLYAQHLAGWHQAQRLARDTRTQQRTEALWLNPAAADALGGTLNFGERNCA